MIKSGTERRSPDSFGMADYLLAEAKIAVVPGRCIRVSGQHPYRLLQHPGKPDRRYEPYGSSFKETWLIWQPSIFVKLSPLRRYKNRSNLAFFPYIQLTTARILPLTRAKAQSVSVKLPTVDWNNICDEKSLKKACECRLFFHLREQQDKVCAYARPWRRRDNKRTLTKHVFTCLWAPVSLPLYKFSHFSRQYMSLSHAL